MLRLWLDKDPEEVAARRAMEMLIARALIGLARLDDFLASFMTDS